MRDISGTTGRNISSSSICFSFGVFLLILTGTLTCPLRADGTPLPTTASGREARLSLLELKSGLAFQFVSLPPWAGKGALPPLPAQLKPMGKASTDTNIPLVTTPGTSTPPSSPSMPPKGPRAETPPLVAVSPFLQWIQKNPQAATEEARKQANNYLAPASSPSPVPGAADQGTPYWLPPAAVSNPVEPVTTGGGSSAIYQTPQR